eukprot:CAMPEP_0114432380 /NCGR_PEP_ID=MMETSP0103-20121206/11125_1 /TAXON_ID=37642 ORGANISM="Paraphysomonas imperforata, Strain PA2" /NCGR_SAMPLE_ID=MMETSP0103 /ASSEMBLY_ACC=CAM_ASM_000201 /LENGTH=1408 /DNA_ID=CAMNT_0001602053 /DNA_START=145 /DNA_END=4371 /DNA_ORIENTATION=-
MLNAHLRSNSNTNVRKTINLGGGSGAVIKKKPFEKAIIPVDDVNDVAVEMYKSKDSRLKPDKVYRFHCGGVLAREYNKMRKGVRAVDKEVKYRAEFSGSVEEFVYPSLRAGQESKNDTSSQPVDFSNEDEAAAKQADDYALHWKLDIDDTPDQDVKKKEASVILAEKGENTLRARMRKTYRQRFVKEKAAKSIHSVTQMSRVVRKQNMLNNLYGEKKREIETPDDVYYEMVSKSNQEEFSRKVQHNINTSFLERSYDEKAETLATVLPSSLTDPSVRTHMSGLLYYQIKKDLTEKKVNDRMSTNLQAMNVHKLQIAAVNHSEDSDSDDGDSLPSMKDKPRPQKGMIRSMSSIQERAEKFRSHRGISQDVTDDSDEAHTEANIHAMTHLKQANHQEYTCNALGRIKRAHYSHLNGCDIGYSTDDGVTKQPSVDELKRKAQDLLLSQELRQGVIPEQLLRKIPRMGDLISLDLSHYSMGDDLCLCLGRSLGILDMLHTLGLRGNRLTHKSLGTIFNNVSLRALRHLDVSMNNITGPSFDVLCSRLSSQECKLSSLEMVKSCITYDEVRKVTEAIMSHETSWLMELSLAQNKLGLEAMRQIVKLLKYEGCAISWLDLSWNEFNSTSGETLANALTENKSLTSLDLSSNALRDEGGQHIAACLLSNKRLQEVYLALNNIGGKTCFIFSKVLRRHPSMKRLNLSDNPLTEAGARSIFRTILKGLRCFVMMQSCTFNSENGLFKHSNPSLDSPYTLDLAMPYEVSILSELINMVNNSTSHCTFRNISYKPNSKDKAVEISSEIVDGETYLRCGSNPWGIPSTGQLTVHFQHQLTIPQEDMAIDELAFNTILAIVVNARSENDRKNWLFLMCMDAYFTTSQAQDLIDILDDRRLLGPGGISVVEFFRCIWSNIIDTQNIYDFMYHNLDDSERISLMHLLSFEKFKFNWINPTGHWRLDLSNRVQRSVMMQLIALNIVESKASKKARRGDTSQKGNWCNFRNEKINSSSIEIGMEFSKSLPWSGVLEFDYVSTTRPPPGVEEISDEDFSDFIVKLDLTTRRRCDVSRSAVKLLELQLAVTNYYFKASRVINILDCFSEDDMTQARVVIVLFCRIVDLYNLELVFRHLTAFATQDLFQRLGVLNCINPLKPTHNLKLNMRHMDCRILAHTFLSMSSLENGDQLKQHPRSEVDIIVLYSQLGRVIQEEYSTDTYLMFSYCEIGERQSDVQWSYRKDMCKLFLVGSRPWDTKMFRIIKMYKEIVAAKALMMGPIDLQYKAFSQHKSARKLKSSLKTAGIVSKLKNETIANRYKESSEDESSTSALNYNDSSLFSSVEDSQNAGDYNTKLFESRRPRIGSTMGDNLPPDDGATEMVLGSIDSNFSTPGTTPGVTPHSSALGGASMFSNESESTSQTMEMN